MSFWHTFDELAAELKPRADAIKADADQGHAAEQYAAPDPRPDPQAVHRVAGPRQRVECPETTG